MSKKGSGRLPPTRRQEFVRAAAAARVPVEYADKAVILGQIAALLAADHRIGPEIAFKGGAVMRLIDASPRLSKDLDAVVVTGKPIQRPWVEQALSTAHARPVVLGVDKAGGYTTHGLLIPIIHCRSLSGLGKVTVSLSFQWREPPIEQPMWGEFTLPNGQTARIPVLVPPERAAEKVRAYLTPERVARMQDAYDLYQYSSRILTAPQWDRLPGLVHQKLAHEICDVPRETDLHALFDQYTDEIAAEWATAPRIIAIEPTPPWAVVIHHLSRVRGAVPRYCP